jgi:predicted HicB family RNase H-like nuclease
MSIPTDINLKTSDPPKKVNLTIRVDQDLYDLLVIVAKQEGRSLSSQSNRFLCQATTAWTKGLDLESYVK